MIADRKLVSREERLGGHWLFALGLNSNKLHRAFTARDEQRLDAEYGSRLSALLIQAGGVYPDALAADDGSRDRPRIESHG